MRNIRARALESMPGQSYWRRSEPARRTRKGRSSGGSLPFASLGFMTVDGGVPIQPPGGLDDPDCRLNGLRDHLPRIGSPRLATELAGEDEFRGEKSAAIQMARGGGRDRGQSCSGMELNSGARWPPWLGAGGIVKRGRERKLKLC